MNSTSNNMRRIKFQIDKLKCKKLVIKFIIEGKTLDFITKEISKSGEKCSRSSIGRYKNTKFIKGCINVDGSIEVHEKEGLRTKVTKYPSSTSSDDIQIDFYI